MIHFHWQLDVFLTRGDLPLYTTCVPAGTHPALQLHDHGNGIELVLVCGGTAKHIQPPFSSPLSRGDILLIPSGVIHAYDDCDDLEIRNLIYEPDRLVLPRLDSYSLPFFQLLFSPRKKHGETNTVAPVMHLEEDNFSEILNVFDRLDSERSGIQPGKQFYTLSILMELLLKLSRFSELKTITYQPRFLIAGALEYMRKHYARPITIDQISKAAGMSRRNLFRYFQTLLGCTPHDYLAKIRLQHAAELLLQTNLTLSEIAFRCGFCDSNYFTKQFRKEYSTTPFHFRKEHIASPENSLSWGGRPHGENG